MKAIGLCKCGCGKKTALRDRGPRKGQPRDYLQGHGYPTTADYRVDPRTGCWNFTKGLRNGYGRVWRDGRIHTAHVWYWEQKHGPVPEGLDLDHLCHDPATCAGGMTCPHRACVNPDHLEPVSRATNTRRGAQTKLTQADVDIIRAAEPYWGYRRDLAARFGVSRIAISKLRAGVYWPD